jgi:P27 family predicted phage terminase small subunit
VKGQRPKPVARQIAEGDPSKRGVHKLDERLETEPKATRGLPSCPKHLKGIARKAWHFWAEELEQMNLDHRPDGPMLQGACISFATAVEMHELVEAQGKLVAKKERNPVTGQMEVVDVRPHPALAIRDRALTQLRLFGSEFGFSPVSRARLFVEQKETEGQDLLTLLIKPREPRPEKEEVVQ